jgi:hypothetical protein
MLYLILKVDSYIDVSQQRVFILKIQAGSHAIPWQNKIWIDQATKLLAIKLLYNIYNVPGVYYCDIIRNNCVNAIRVLCNIIYSIHGLFCIIKYSNCTARNERVFVFDFTTRLITGRELYLDTILDHRVSAMPKQFIYSISQSLMGFSQSGEHV